MKIKIAILAQAFVVMGILVSATVLGEIAMTFPDASLTGIQLIMTFAMVAGLVFTLVAGWLGNHMDKKTISIIAMIILFIGGMLPIVLNSSLIFLYISSLLMGVGQGLLMTNIPAICAELYEGDTQSAMFGWQTALQNGGTVVLMLLAGQLAFRYGWTNAYWVFLLVIIAVIVTVIWMPKMPPVAAASASEKDAAGSTFPPVGVFVVSILLAIYFAAYSTFFLNAPIYITEEGLGDPSMIGVVLSVSTALGFVGGIIFVYVLKIVKRYTMALSALVTGLGYLALVLSPNMTTVFVASICSGGAFAIALSAGIQAVSEMSTPAQMSNSMGVNMAFTTLGGAASPVVVNTLAVLAPGEGTMAAFATSIGILFVLTVAFAIWAVAAKGQVINQAA